MNIYLRKILKHDITHQISVTKEILNGFFGVFEEKESTQMKGKHSGFIGTVTFLLSTDPRFGGEIKQIINNEGGMDEDDILLFVKSKNGFVLEVVKNTDPRHDTFVDIMREERHLIVNIDDEIDNSDSDKFNYNVFGMHIKNENDALSDDRPHICIGWSAMGNLTAIENKEELSSKHQEVYPESNTRAKGQNVGQIWRFIKEMKIGDYVVFADGNMCHIGQIESDCYYDDNAYPNQSNDYVNVRDVKWLKTNIPRNELSASFHHSLMTGMSVWGLNDYKSVVYELLNGTYVKDVFELSDEDDEVVDIEKGNTNYTIDDLGDILTEMYNGTGNKTTAVHMFGFKYGGVIEKNNYTTAKIISASEIPDSYHVELNKGTAIYRAVKDNEYGVRFADDSNKITNIFDYNTTKGSSECKILFGIPGCGKSYHIDHDILGKDKKTKEYYGNYEKENIIRTTFYQDYSNTDFIGQILPKVTKNENGDSVVEYSFNPGPFTLALIQAIKNPTKKVALVIEEINRGNAPAIFGDIFQLLDRDDDSVSQYGIVNVGIIDYLNSLDFDVDGEKIKYIFNEIKIPGNMDIFATMNTSDQNVYTLDTAFTRRWAKERIPNDFGDNEEIKNKAVPGMNEYTWSEFVESINSYIDDHLDDLQINEDKKIGAFFVGLTTLDNVDEFAYKVLDYLWSDVSKLDHNVIFNNYKTFESLIKDYKSKGVKVFRPNIFEEKVAAHPQEEEENE